MDYRFKETKLPILNPSFGVFQVVISHFDQKVGGPIVAALSLADLPLIFTIEFHAVSDVDHQVRVFSFLLRQLFFLFADFEAFLIIGQLLEHLFGLQNGDGSFHSFDHSAHYHFDKSGGEFRIFIDNFEPDLDVSFGQIFFLLFFYFLLFFLFFRF